MKRFEVYQSQSHAYFDSFEAAHACALEYAAPRFPTVIRDHYLDTEPVSERIVWRSHPYYPEG